MWRSIALSGWGQASNHEWKKAVFFSATELTLLASAYHQHTEWQSLRDRFNSGDIDPSQSDLVSHRRDLFMRDRNKLLWWWLWAKLACVLDAYVSGSMSNFDTHWPEDALKLQAWVAPPSYGTSSVGLSLSIPIFTGARITQQ
jgi:hypothetical protein